VQSYEKSRAKQKKLFFFLPRRGKFAIFDGKVTKKVCKEQRILEDLHNLAEIKARREAPRST
jgi:hypothetical protein